MSAYVLVGPSKQLKQIIRTRNITLLRIPADRRQTSWLLTSVTEDLTSGLPETDPGRSQNGYVLVVRTRKTAANPDVGLLIHERIVTSMLEKLSVIG